MFKASSFAVCVLAAGFAFATVASAQSSPPSITVNGVKPDATQYAPAPDNPNPPALEKGVYCPTALEPILPGDYYACEARAAAGREHYQKMLDMLKEAAYWANKDAQYVLGLAYFNGDMPEAPLNRPLGLAWLALAAERKNPQYQLVYATARTQSSAAEIRQANLEWQKLRVKYGDSIAAPRAIRRFNHNIQAIDEAARANGIVYLSGFSPFPQSAFAVANKLHDQADTDFSTVHGTVVVGKPDWVQAKPVETGDVK